MNIQQQTVPTRLAWLEGAADVLIEVVSIMAGDLADPDMPPGADDRIRDAVAARIRELADRRATEAVLTALEGNLVAESSS